MTLSAKTFLPVAAVATGLLLAGCGGGGEADPDAAAVEAVWVNPDAPHFDELPEEIKEKGSITVGTDAAYAPMEYYDDDGTTIVGFDPDLAVILGERLGVPLELENATFDGLVTGVKSNRFDIAMAAITDTAERQQEVDMVNYYLSGTIMIVKDGNPHDLQSVEDLCGETVALQRGNVQQDYAEGELTEQCEAKGEPAPELLLFDKETEAMLQIEQDRAVAGLQDYPVAQYSVNESGGKFETIGDQVTAAPLGIAVSKDDTQLRDAIQAALQSAIDDGSYAELLDRYEVPQAAVEEAAINQGG